MKLLNDPKLVETLRDKLGFLAKISGVVSTVDFTMDIEQAGQWLKQGKDVVVYPKINGKHTTQPFVTIDETELVIYKSDGHLYTKYYPKSNEYRVYIFGGEIFKIEELITRSKTVLHEKIRLYGSGYNYVTCELDNEEICGKALKTIEHLGLTFGAVDIIYNKLMDQSFVIGVKTEPSLSKYLANGCILETIDLDYCVAVQDDDTNDDEEYKEDE